MEVKIPKFSETLADSVLSYLTMVPDQQNKIQTQPNKRPKVNKRWCKRWTRKQETSSSFLATEREHSYLDNFNYNGFIRIFKINFMRSRDGFCNCVYDLHPVNSTICTGFIQYCKLHRSLEKSNSISICHKILDCDVHSSQGMQFALRDPTK